MSKENIIFEEIVNLKKKMELLANPLYNDAGGSTFWREVYDKIDEAHKLLIKDKRIYGW